MGDFGQWALAGMLAAVFVAANWINVALLLDHRRRPGAPAPSLLVLVGGIGGTMACALAPSETLRTWYWVPLLLDVGTGPYLAIRLASLAGRAWKAANWLEYLPFVHHYARAARTSRPATGVVPLETAIIGCLLGTAVGDALGLPAEGLSRRRQQRLFSTLDRYRLLPGGKGLCSDDTEHTCMLAQSLIATAHFRDPDGMGRRLGTDFAWRLRFWLLGLPAGIGFATLRATIKLWLGIPPHLSGVHSAGNAPAMRSALIGICHGEDVPRMRALVRAATRVTHTDIRAQIGAQAVALAAHLAATRDRPVAPQEYLAALEPYCERNGEVLDRLRSLAASLAHGETAAEYMATLGCARGVTGYMWHTVPAALHVWLRHQSDYRGALIEAVQLGGDTDTVAAIVGALVGARVGRAGIPGEWLRDLWEWPRTPDWIAQLGARLALSCHERASVGTLPVHWFELLLRNLVFMPVVLAHGLRRLLPPW